MQQKCLNLEVDCKEDLRSVGGEGIEIKIEIENEIKNGIENGIEIKNEIKIENEIYNVENPKEETRNEEDESVQLEMRHEEQMMWNQATTTMT